MLEPIQGEAGVLPADATTSCAALRALTRERGLLLILDEIQTGIGRTGRLFGFEHRAASRPDIMTLGKGLGGGVPLAALVAQRDVCCFEHGDQGGTFNGNPLMAAVGCAVIEPWWRSRRSSPHVRAMGDYLPRRLRALSADLGRGEVRGPGLLLAPRSRAGRGRKVVDAARDARSADQRAAAGHAALHAGADRHAATRSIR